jgi:DNA-binding response OmpR family regulator
VTRSPLVLIADDEIDIRDLVVRILERSGFDLVVARDGAEAWALAGSLRPDVAVLDAMMPLRSGYDVARSIRGVPDLAQTRILMLSACARDADIARSRAAGADDHLSKPFRSGVLVARVQALVEAPACDSSRGLPDPIVSCPITTR